MNVLEKIDQKKGFTQTEAQVITYIKDNLEIIPQITISALAKETYSSNATIIRICQKLGFNGFRDFKYEIVKGIETSKFINNNAVDFTKPFNYSKSIIETMNSM